MGKYFFWFAVFSCFCFLVYEVKYNVQEAQRKTHQMEAELLAERERIHMLELEWARLTRPERIRLLADKYLDLRPAQPQRIMTEDKALWSVSYMPEDGTP